MLKGISGKMFSFLYNNGSVEEFEVRVNRHSTHQILFGYFLLPNFKMGLKRKEFQNDSEVMAIAEKYFNGQIFCKVKEI